MRAGRLGNQTRRCEYDGSARCFPSPPAQPVPPTARHLALFDLYAGLHKGGHPAEHLMMLARAWVEQQRTGRLSIVAPAALRTAHPDLAAYVDAHAAEGLALVDITEPLAVTTPRRAGLVRNDWDHGRLAERYFQRLRPDHGLFMYVDHVQLSLALRLRFSFPIGLSGLYFRPSFHYDALAQAAGTEADVPPRERLTRLRKRVQLIAALRNPHLTHLFCLDPYVIPHLDALQRGRARRVQGIFVPDGIESKQADPAAVEAMRARWAPEPGRRVALLFGVISERKGVQALLKALPLLPADLQRQLTIVFAGNLTPQERPTLSPVLATADQATQVQIVPDLRFIPDAELPAVVHAADLVLLPYQRHVGSSGVLIRAAAAERPVLGSDYGLVGQHIRQHRLGLAVDTTDPARIADGLRRFLMEGVPFDSNAARHFAAQNTAEGYTTTIFDTLGIATGRPAASPDPSSPAPSR